MPIGIQFNSSTLKVHYNPIAEKVIANKYGWLYVCAWPTSGDECELLKIHTRTGELQDREAYTDSSGIVTDSEDKIYLAHVRTSPPYRTVTKRTGWKDDLVWGYDTVSQWAKDVIVDDVGNVYVVGECANNKSVWKLNSSGALQWSYDTGDDTESIYVDNAGNVYVVGLRANNKSVWKLNSSGALQWSYDTGGDTKDVIVDDAGNVYVCGYSIGNALLRKLNSSGVLQWSWGGLSYSFCLAWDTTKTNLYIGNGGYEFFERWNINKISPAGISLASYNFPIAYDWYDRPITIDVADNGHIFTGSPSYLFYCLDSNLNFVWKTDKYLGGCSASAWMDVAISYKGVLGK